MLVFRGVNHPKQPETKRTPSRHVAHMEEMVT